LNLILLERSDFASWSREDREGRVRLTGRRRDHVSKIHGAGVGDRLCVGLRDGPVGTGAVTHLDPEALEMEVVLERDPPAALPVDLILAMPRPLVLKRVLIAATSMGVKRIVLLNTNRVERSFWNSKVLRDGQLEEPLRLGLEQARDTHMPEVLLRTRFKAFVEDELPERLEGTTALVAHPEANAVCPSQVEGPVTLVVGPEGGFVPYEIEKLEALGLEAVHLGDRVLRVETAVPVLLARLSP
jgi:16S rRNA (uracil1498-N3)-methyltransferase